MAHSAHTTQAPEQPAVEQLALLSPADLPLQFRLDKSTRERGVPHIAALKAQLAARAAARQGEPAPVRKAA